MADEEGQPADAVARAEALLEGVLSRVARVAAAVGGRVREEAEDVWAEAQALKRDGERSD